MTLMNIYDIQKIRQVTVYISTKILACVCFHDAFKNGYYNGIQGVGCVPYIISASPVFEL